MFEAASGGTGSIIEPIGKFDMKERQLGSTRYSKILFQHLTSRVPFVGPPSTRLLAPAPNVGQPQPNPNPSRNKSCDQSRDAETRTCRPKCAPVQRFGGSTSLGCPTPDSQIQTADSRFQTPGCRLRMQIPDSRLQIPLGSATTDAPGSSSNWVQKRLHPEAIPRQLRRPFARAPGVSKTDVRLHHQARCITVLWETFQPLARKKRELCETLGEPPVVWKRAVQQPRAPGLRNLSGKGHDRSTPRIRGGRIPAGITTAGEVVEHKFLLAHGRRTEDTRILDCQLLAGGDVAHGEEPV
ncbi:hypothetical protein B0H17DRAFT_1142001 [Mycena rosella]|uniref:Uncharacterized protein n=1 Tax=Mycena rosella TaxID=1033263 RepID=A0AAD7CYR9_MYCRO|nr:hypothetical protein B0H17DRAFT_1142001 [Mycena rosella]